MSAIPSSALPCPARGRGDWEATAQSLRRAALAVARADSPQLFGDFIRQLTEDLDAALLRDERRTALLSAFAELSDRDRELLTLLVTDPPIPYADISSRLGMPIGSIGPTRARVLAKLRGSPRNMLRGSWSRRIT